MDYRTHPIKNLIVRLVSLKFKMSTNSPLIFVSLFCIADKRNQQQLNYKNQKSIICDYAVCGI